MITTILAIIAVPVAMAISTLVVMLLVKVFVWLKSKIQYDELYKIFDIVHEAMTAVINELSTEVIADLKTKCADGKLTKEEAKEVLDMISAKVKDILGPAIINTIKKLGISFTELILALLAKYLLSQ